MTPNVNIINRARQMAAEGFGYEDIAVKLNISRANAYWFVFGKEKEK